MALENFTSLLRVAPCLGSSRIRVLCISYVWPIPLFLSLFTTAVYFVIVPREESYGIRTELHHY
jgi:hypothetical protein